MKITHDTRTERVALPKVSRYCFLAIYPAGMSLYIASMMLRFPDLRLPLGILLCASILALGIIIGFIAANLIWVGQSMKKVVFRMGIHMERADEARFYTLDRMLTEEECEDLQEYLTKSGCDHSMKHGADMNEYDINVPVKEWAEAHGVTVQEDETYENIQLYV